jgi:hypothetical protein
MEHNWLAYMIKEELGIEEDRLVKLAQSQIAPNEPVAYWGNDDCEPTMEQVATTVIWCQKHGALVPVWAEPRLEV